MTIKNLLHGLTVLAASSTSLMAAPQPVSQIIAVVNKDAITADDLEARYKFFMFTSGVKDAGNKSTIMKQIMQSLIEDTIKRQAAETQHIIIPDEAIDAELEKIAQSNGATLDQMTQNFKSQGVSIKTFRDSIRAQIAWVEYVRAKHGQSVQVSEKEINETLEKIKQKSGETQYSYVEVFLNIDSPSQETSVRQQAENILSQLKSSSNPQAIARQFSQSTSAQQGGMVTLVSENRLDPALKTAFQSAGDNNVVGPVRVNGGFLVAKLMEKRFAGQADANLNDITLCQVSVSLPEESNEAALTELKTKLDEISEVKGCAAFKDKIKNMGAQATEQTIKMGQLPPELRTLVNKTGMGRCLQPMRTDEHTLTLMMPCNMKKAEFKLPTHDEINNMLQSQKMERFAHRDRMKLFSIAYIDVKDPNLAPAHLSGQSSKTPKN